MKRASTPPLPPYVVTYDFQKLEPASKKQETRANLIREWRQALQDQQP